MPNYVVLGLLLLCIAASVWGIRRYRVCPTRGVRVMVTLCVTATVVVALLLLFWYVATWLLVQGID